MSTTTGNGKAPDYTVIGGSGLDSLYGNLYDEPVTILSGARGRRTYREMREADPVVGAFMFAIDMLVRQVDWPVNAADDSAEAQAWADFVTECLHDMSIAWADTISSVMSFLTYGFSYFEILYKQRLGDTSDPTTRSRYTDGRISWRKLALRPQDTLDGWQLDDDGGVQGMYQRAAPRYDRVLIPIEKALLFRTTAERPSPEGRSVLRNAYRPWYNKKHIENIEGIGIERDLAGLPVARVPLETMLPSATPDQRATFETIKRIVTNIRRDSQEGIVMPSSRDASGNLLYDVILLSTGGTRQFDTDKVISRYDQRIAMTVLADFILLGHEQVGSKALSVDKTQVFGVALGAWLDHIAGIFNSHAIPRLMRLNGVPADLYPELDHSDIEPVNLAQLADYVSKLATAGAAFFPNADLERYLLDVAGLPAPTEAGNEPPPPAVPEPTAAELAAGGLGVPQP